MKNVRVNISGAGSFCLKKGGISFGDNNRSKYKYEWLENSIDGTIELKLTSCGLNTQTITFGCSANKNSSTGDESEANAILGKVFGHDYVDSLFSAGNQNTVIINGNTYVQNATGGCVFSNVCINGVNVNISNANISNVCVDINDNHDEDTSKIFKGLKWENTNIVSLSISGSVTVNVEACSLKDSVEINMSGSSKVIISGAARHLNKLDIRSSGSSSFIGSSGNKMTVDNLSITSSGSSKFAGSLYGSDFSAKRLDVKASGSTSVGYLSVTESIKINLGGCSRAPRIKKLGNCNIDLLSVTGASSYEIV